MGTDLRLHSCVPSKSLPSLFPHESCPVRLIVVRLGRRRPLPVAPRPRGFLGSGWAVVGFLANGVTL